MATKRITVREAFRVLRRIYNQPRFARVLQELDTKPKARAAAKRDARGYLTDKGIKLPKEVTARFGGNKWKLTICIWIFCIHFEHD